MIVKPTAADSFVHAPSAAVRVALVYGPDAGLVRERADALVIAAAGRINDPFRVAPLSPAALDRAQLHDEAASIAFGGGRRAIIMRDASDGVSDALGHFLDAPPPGDTLVVLSAGDLGKRSSLRLLCETRANAAALPCYVVDGIDRDRLLRVLLTEAGLSADDDALAALARALPGDRALLRGEVGKLALYLWPEKRATAAAVAAITGDALEVTQDELAFAVAEGDVPALERAYASQMEAGISPVPILRAVARHFERLHLTAARIRAGRAVADAVGALRPLVFWKHKPRFEAQARAARSESLARAIDSLQQAEADAKTTGLPERTLAHRALTRIALTQRR